MVDGVVRGSPLAAPIQRNVDGEGVWIFEREFSREME
jgi:hypothetical protein